MPRKLAETFQISNCPIRPTAPCYAPVTRPSVHLRPFLTRLPALLQTQFWSLPAFHTAGTPKGSQVPGPDPQTLPLLPWLPSTFQYLTPMSSPGERLRPELPPASKPLNPRGKGSSPGVLSPVLPSHAPHCSSRPSRGA